MAILKKHQLLVKAAVATFWATLYFYIWPLWSVVHITLYAFGLVKSFVDFFPTENDKKRGTKFFLHFKLAMKSLLALQSHFYTTLLTLKAMGSFPVILYFIGLTRQLGSAPWYTSFSSKSKFIKVWRQWGCGFKSRHFKLGW